MSTKQSAFTRRSFCGGLAALAALPLAVPRDSMAQMHPKPQPEIQENTLRVPGATLYYETRGSGPVMLLIPGAPGSAVSGARLAELLAAHYTVVTYDRRGFSLSKLDGPQDYGRRLETDANDVRHLIAHVGKGPATVFGSSSGAIIALELFKHHPSVVRTVVPYEPPIMKQLPDGQKWVDFFFEIYDLYRKPGLEPAMNKFRDQTFAEVDRQAMVRAPKTEHTLPNADYWFEHELRQYPAINLDLNALTPRADRILFAVGRDSRGYPCYEVTAILSKKLGREMIELPGGHIGHRAMHPSSRPCWCKLLPRQRTVRSGEFQTPRRGEGD
jgi:acetyltransferase/esterase